MRYLILAVALSACGAPPEFDCKKSGCDGGQTCSVNTGRCVGGGTGGGGGSACSGCSGCCLDGVCKVGTAAAACGKSGAVCAVCSDHQTCSANACKLTCDNTTCPSGCCSGGSCEPGTAFVACGGSGNTCFSCSSTQACDSRSRSCVTPLTVTMRYRYGGSLCDQSVCEKALLMTGGDYTAISADYSSCTLLEPTASTRTIDCTGVQLCATPKGCSNASCSWVP